MANHVLSAAIHGIEARGVRVEIDSSPGIYALSIVGLADKAVQESQDRVNAAIRNSGFLPPESKNRRYIVNLSPADLKKEGSLFDLPIAVSFLIESGQVDTDTDGVLYAGELGLDGVLRPIKGALSLALFARDNGIRRIIVPRENAEEASCIQEVQVMGASNLVEVAAHLDGSKPLPAVQSPPGALPPDDDSFSYIQGQFAAKRALVIAAAGGHNILLEGPPGSGKTLLARSLIGLMPPLSQQEALQTAKVHSAVGLLQSSPVCMPRPFRSPHHTSSPASIVGGGTTPRPGEISLAHRGVLFLDEFPEFARNVLESLRQPLEEGQVTVSRAAGTITLPASFLLVAAMNPCPCGNHGDPRLSCVCAPTQIARYIKKISGPLLDRIDIQINVPRETPNIADGSPDIESLAKARELIRNARTRQAIRFTGEEGVTNSDISFKRVSSLCHLSGTALALLEDAVTKKSLSQRVAQKIRKVSRTIADLDDSNDIRESHVAEALSLRLSAQQHSFPA